MPAAAEPDGPVIQDGVVAQAKGIFTEAAGEPVLTITGGSLEVAEWIWWGDGENSFGIWTMSGGTVTVAEEFELGWGGGAGTLIMTGGTINAGEAVIPTGSGAFGQLFLHGGTYNVTQAGGLEVNENGLIDITEGTLVLEGDETAKINDLIAAGRITAYGSDGLFQVDYDERNPGRTTVTATEGFVFLSDDFESYVDDAGLAAAGWIILDTNEAIEASTWTVTNPGGRDNPATLDGSASTGKFLISDSDQQSESNPVDSGASHDAITPSFSTLGYATVWLHADVSAQLNNNGAAIFDVEVSTDGGDTWINVFSRVSPGRASSEGATTRLPDNTNTDGYSGRLDVNLSAVASDEPDVRVRFRHFEPNWDWWIAIDNILIDDVPAPQGGPVTVFSEDFSNGLGQMNVVSGQGNTGTETWHTTDKGGRYDPGTVQEHGVNRLGPHPDENPEFAIIDSDADPDPSEDEWLMTPSLDLSGLAEVFLHYESETVMSSGVWNQEVLVSLDGGITFEVTPIFAYTGGGLFDNGEEPVYAQRIFDVSTIAAGKSQVVFAFRYTGDGDDWWWAIDNVKVSGVDPSLAVYYSFDEVGDIVADQSGNGYDGLVVGDIVADPNGALGGGAEFADGGYLDLDGPNVPPEDIPTFGMTLAAWIKCTNTGSHHALFNARASDETWVVHPEARNNGEFRWLLRSYGGTTLFDIHAGVVTWDEWLHFAGTYDKASGKAALCINGEMVSEMDVTNPADIAGDWGLGARVGKNIDDARPFTGLMDEFRLLTRALSQEEIVDMMAGM